MHHILYFFVLYFIVLKTRYQRVLGVRGTSYTLHFILYNSNFIVSYFLVLKTRYWCVLGVLGIFLLYTIYSFENKILMCSRCSRHLSSSLLFTHKNCSIIQSLGRAQILLWAFYSFYLFTFYFILFYFLQYYAINLLQFYQI